MTRIVELLVAVSALAGIATFLGFRTMIRRTLRTLGRKPESHSFRELNSQTRPVSPAERARARQLAEGGKGEEQ